MKAKPICLSRPPTFVVHSVGGRVIPRLPLNLLLSIAVSTLVVFTLLRGNEPMADGLGLSVLLCGIAVGIVSLDRLRGRIVGNRRKCRGRQPC